MAAIHDPASYDFVLKRVIRWLGIADPNYPEGNVVAPTAPYTTAMIRQQIIQSDLEVAALIASVEEHPYRNTYFTAAAVSVAAGEKIPGYIGVHGKVLVTIDAADVPGKLANSLEHLQRVKDKYAIGATLIPASSKALYWIDNGVVHLVAATAFKIELPRLPFDLDDVPDELLTPQIMANAVVAHAVFTAMPVGSDAAHRTRWQNIWSGYAQIIMGGGYSLPEPERMQRIAS